MSLEEANEFDCLYKLLISLKFEYQLTNHAYHDWKRKKVVLAESRFKLMKTTFF